MAHLNASALSTYNSLVDPNLKCYFSNERIQSHLKHIGLIDRRGEIISDKEYRTRLFRREHKQHVRQRLAESIVYNAIDMERARQAELRRKYELDSKRELVKQITQSRNHRARSSTDALSHMDEIGRSTLDSSFHRRKDHNSHSDADIENVQSIESNKISRAHSAKIHQPYHVKSQSKLSNNRRLNRPKSSHIPRTSSVKQSHSLSKQIDKSSCQITMVYYGHQANLEQDHSQSETTYEILVMQQHCGGENLIVYKNHLKVGDNFTFDSRRHQNYPFGLSFYINGLIDSRISTCCEYRHRHGVRLGGERGHFAILSVQGSKPCLKCRFDKQIRSKEYGQSNESVNQSLNEEKTIEISIQGPTEKRNIRAPLKIPVKHFLDENDSSVKKPTTKTTVFNHYRSSTDSTSPQSPLSKEHKNPSTVTSEKGQHKINSGDDHDDYLPDENLSTTESLADEESPTKTWQIIFHTSNIPMGSLQFPIDSSFDGQLKFSFISKTPPIETELHSINLKDFPQCFKSSRQDSFAAKLKNIGIPEQIRLFLEIHDENSMDLKWHLDHIELIDPETQLHFNFSCQQWIRVNEDYFVNITKTPGRLSLTRKSSSSTNNSKSSIHSNNRKRTRFSHQQRNKSIEQEMSSSSSTLEQTNNLPSQSKIKRNSLRSLTHEKENLIPFQLILHTSKSTNGEFNPLPNSQIFIRFNHQTTNLTLIDPRTKTCPSFVPGAKRIFDIEISLDRDENLFSLTIGYKNSDITATKWKLDKIILINKITQDETIFECDQAILRDDFDLVGTNTFYKKSSNQERPSSSSSSQKSSDNNDQQEQINEKNQLNIRKISLNKLENLSDIDKPSENKSDFEIKTRPKTRRGRDEEKEEDEINHQQTVDQTETKEIWRPPSQCDNEENQRFE